MSEPVNNLRPAQKVLNIVQTLRKSTLGKDATVSVIGIVLFMYVLCNMCLIDFGGIPQMEMSFEQYLQLLLSVH